MNMNKVHFSSNNQDWETPAWLFDKLDKVFNFTLDPCASKDNAKCETYFTKEDNALDLDWSGIAFVNPPYERKRGVQDLWVKKCFVEAISGTSSLMLIPARTETKRWQTCIFMQAEAICFINGRVKFELNGAAQGSPAFPSALVWFNFDVDMNRKQKQVLERIGAVMYP